MRTLALREARALALAASGLDQQPTQASKADVLYVLRQLGVIQIDTIHVVARSPYLVLWSRLGQYDPRWFDELHYPDGLLFEYWAHAASFLPIEYWPLFRAAMLNYDQWGGTYARTWMQENQQVLEDVRNTIAEQGPQRSINFKKPDEHPGGGWWNWKPAKRALDQLWTMGELMIQRRINFQRVYELTERMLPDWDDVEAPSMELAQSRLSEIALRAMGIATARQLADYFRQSKRGLPELLKQWAAAGIVDQVQVEGWNEPAFVHKDHRGWLEHGAPTPQLTTLLSPFDNLIWDRERTAALWQFEYKLECYTPAAQRRYGYFSLPILWKDQLVGRLDAKAERKQGIFRVFALHLEPQIELSEELATDMWHALQACAEWHATPEVVIEKTEPAVLATLLR